MSIEDYGRSLLAEMGAKFDTKPADAAEPEEDKREKPEPNKPDPQEVQYPGYFEGSGSL